MNGEILVFARWNDNCHKIGTLRITEARGKEIISFSYDGSWIDSGGISIDPELPLIDGSQYPPEEKIFSGHFQIALRTGGEGF